MENKTTNTQRTLELVWNEHTLIVKTRISWCDRIVIAYIENKDYKYRPVFLCRNWPYKEVNLMRGRKFDTLQEAKQFIEQQLCIEGEY